MNFSRNNPPERIFLIGFMGSGKTFTGKKLADIFGWEFLDLDEKIAANSGMAIPEIFQKQGEAHFRELEQAALRETFFLKKTVVATGGGTPCFFKNMEEMSQKGLVIYLKATQKLLFDRLCDSPGSRPLIAEKSKKELRDFIKTKLEERNGVYQKANLVCGSSKFDAESLGKLLKKLIVFDMDQP